jgi:hypothetical protein
MVTLGSMALLLLGSATAAFAPHVARLEIESGTAGPGDEISVFGPDGYGPDSEVVLRWDDPDGEVLATVEPHEGFYAPFGPVTVTIPEDATNGQHLIVATQDLNEDERYIRGLPAYAQIQVVGGAEPAGEDAAQAAPGGDAGVERVSTLSEAEPPGAGLLVLIGLLTFAVALRVAAVVTRAVRGSGRVADRTEA